MTRRVETLRFSDGAGPVAVPVVEVRGAKDGPTVVVTANVHGDETTGTAAALDLSRWLGDRIERGRVVLYPSVNPRGLAAGTRTFGEGGPDLNRLFPGDPEGDAGARFVALLWADLVARAPHVLVDLHADTAASIPYAIVDRAVAHSGRERAAMDGALARVARVTGLTVLNDYPDTDYLRFGLDRSLAGAAVNRLGVPAVTIEAGPRGRLDAEAVTVAMDAVKGILVDLGVIAAVQIPVRRVDGGPWRRRGAPRVRRGGLFRPALAPGQTFSRGDSLGRVVSLVGDVHEELRAAFDGVVVSWLDDAWVQPGTGVGTLAIRDGEV